MRMENLYLYSTIHKPVINNQGYTCDPPAQVRALLHTPP